jgi:hypothetical protein
VPYDDPDPSDPMTLHGVGVETDDANAMREMGMCFIEEYLRLGFDADRLLQLFKCKGFAGPNMVLEALGEPAIHAMIAEGVGLRGPRMALRYCSRPIEHCANGEISLTVLDS